MEHVVPEDRGLGTAYERWCFYQLLDQWARDFEVETFLEGPIDGMAGVAGVHGVGLAKRGVKVVTALPTEEHAAVARGVYARCDAPVEVVVAGQQDVDTLPKADMVVCYHALSFVDDCAAELEKVAAKAKKDLPDAIKRWKAGDGELFVKGPFDAGDAGTEYMWIEATGCDAKTCNGILANDPGYASNLAQGKPASVAKDKTADWMLRLKDGGTAGGESIRVLTKKP